MAPEIQTHHTFFISLKVVIQGCNFLYSFPKQLISDSSKLKEFADDNFKFDENGRKLSKQVENTVVKEKIAPYKQFLIFLKCFKMTYTADTYKPGPVWERVNVTKL